MCQHVQLFRDSRNNASSLKVTYSCAQLLTLANSCAGLEVSLTLPQRLLLSSADAARQEPSPTRRIFICGYSSFTVVVTLTTGLAWRRRHFPLLRLVEEISTVFCTVWTIGTRRCTTNLFTKFPALCCGCIIDRSSLRLIKDELPRSRYTYNGHECRQCYSGQHVSFTRWFNCLCGSIAFLAWVVERGDSRGVSHHLVPPVSVHYGRCSRCSTFAQVSSIPHGEYSPSVCYLVLVNIQKLIS